MCKCEECIKARDSFYRAFEAMENFIAKNKCVYNFCGFQKFRDAMSETIQVFHKKADNGKIEKVPLLAPEVHLQDKVNEIIDAINDLKEKVDSGKMQ